MTARVFWLVALAGLLWWLVDSIRKRVPHEIWMAAGFVAYVVTLLLGNEVYILAFTPPAVVFYAGMALISVGFILAVASVLTLRFKGNPEGFDDTRQVVETGVYRVVRHPWYLGGILAVTGTTLVWPSLLLGVGWGVAFFCFVRAALAEEAHSLSKFGAEYQRYMERVPRFNLFLGMWHLVQKDKTRL
jgi:protein-S-isoprenylcysteine O-methyltransferase Ste14